jgi:hypothetical protein
MMFCFNKKPGLMPGFLCSGGATDVSGQIADSPRRK